MRVAARWLLVAGAAVLAGSVTAARADVWGLCRRAGVAHFASEQLDDRYELFFRQAESFDTRLDPPPPAAGRRRASVDAAAAATAAQAAGVFRRLARRSSSVKQFLRDASSDHNIDYELLQALIATESGFNASAVSPKGAIGLMQLMPDTARRYGVDTDRHGALERKLTDPRINIRAGIALPA